MEEREIRKHTTPHIVWIGIYPRGICNPDSMGMKNSSPSFACCSKADKLYAHMPLDKESEEQKPGTKASPARRQLSMSQSNNVNRTIKNSWSLLAFAKAHGKMQVGSFKHVNETTGEEEHFKSCIFTDKDDTRVFVSFSQKLGELTPRQIVDMKDELQVVQFEENDNYKLCKQGQSSWEDVDLF